MCVNICFCGIPPVFVKSLDFLIADCIRPFVIQGDLFFYIFWGNNTGLYLKC